MVSFWTSRNSWKGLMKWVYPSFCPSVLLFILLSVLPSGCFLGIISLDISKFWHGARNPYEVVCDTARISRKNFFVPNIGKMDQKWARVFWIYWNILSEIFAEFVLSWKFILFAVLLHKSHIWEKFGSWDMDQNVFTKSDRRNFLINHISITSQWNNLISCKLKVDQNIVFGAMVRNGCGQSGQRTLALTISQECKDGMN